MLEVSELRVSYGRGRVALRDVDLHVAEGDVAVVMGHNGAGKTTLLHSIFGAVPAERGVIRFEGTPLEPGIASRVRRRIAYSPSGQPVFPGLTVAENLEIAALATVATRGAPLPAARKQEVLELFPILAERMGQRAGTLSGGQQRLLALSMALMQDPRLLLLDEPSLGLAPRLVENFYATLAEIRRSLGLTVLVVEQTINPRLLNATRVYILRMGEITFSGGAEALQDVERLWALF